MLAMIMVFQINPVAAYGALSGMGIYFLLPLLIATSASVILFYRRNRCIVASPWARLMAPALSVASLGILFVLTSLNLKMLVGSATMIAVSLVAVIVVPASGGLLAGFYRTYRPAVYATIGNQ